MKNRADEIHTTNEGYKVKIINYNGSANCSVIFTDGTILKDIQYLSIKRGQIKNPYHPSVFGIGYLGEGIYKSRINKVRTKSYTSWQNMLQRCHDKKYQEVNLTYKDSYLIEEWYNFQNFAKWHEDNYIEGFDLDKDILIKNNKIYSPETCCFVPHEINSLIIKCNKTRGKYPIGVNRMNKKFQSIIRINSILRHLGIYRTPEEAFQAYKKAKESYIKEVANKYKNQITEACYEALLNYKVEITD